MLTTDTPKADESRVFASPVLFNSESLPSWLQASAIDGARKRDFAGTLPSDFTVHPNKSMSIESFALSCRATDVASLSFSTDELSETAISIVGIVVGRLCKFRAEVGKI